MSFLLTMLRRHVVAFTALFLVLGGSAFAVAGPVGGKPAAKIYACVTEAHRTLNLTTAKAKCPSGQTKISWNAAGARGSAGKPGAAGSTGAKGATGAAGTVGAKGDTGAKGDAGAKGETGAKGDAGANGEDGAPGQSGAPGENGGLGPAGPAGADGAPGATGPVGPAGPAGTDGEDGAPGAAGEDGAAGPQGPAGVASFSLFYALMPPDNAATVAVGADVDFPQDGPSDDEISRTGTDTFNLAEVGVYRVGFTVPVTEPGQLLLTLNGVDLNYTVTGRATGTSLITTSTLVETTSVNSILTVQNPVGSSSALTITPLAGGTRPVSASLLIERIR